MANQDTRDDIPAGCESLMATSGQVSNGVAAASFVADPLRVNYVQSIMVSAGGATVGALVNLTVTGLRGGAFVVPVSIPTGVLLSITPLHIKFPRPMMATDINVGISASLPALGAGNTHAVVTLIGFKG